MFVTRIRSARPDDIDKFLAFELSLSPGTRYFRFGKVHELAFSREQVEDIFDSNDSRNVHLVVTEGEDAREAMVGSGRLFIPAPAIPCELMFVLRDDYQRKGIGSHLLIALCKEAKLREIPAVYCQVLPTNLRMQRFMRRHGFRQVPNPDHELLLRFEKAI